jgi:hypothetical protein
VAEGELAGGVRQAIGPADQAWQSPSCFFTNLLVVAQAMAQHLPANCLALPSMILHSPENPGLLASNLPACLLKNFVYYRLSPCHTSSGAEQQEIICAWMCNIPAANTWNWVEVLGEYTSQLSGRRLLL